MTQLGGLPKPPRNGLSCKRKGYEFEREFVNDMRGFGLECRRVPLSGAGHEKGDVVLQPGCMPKPLKGELKRRKCLPEWIVNALGDHDFMAMREDRGKTLVVIDLELFRTLLQ